MDKKKRCCKCKTRKGFKAFSSNKSAKDGLQDWCKRCQHSAYEDSYAQRNKDNAHHIMEVFRKRQYNLDAKTFNMMFEKQKGRCAICRCLFDKSIVPHVDHDHTCCSGQKSCGKCIRGLLCGLCNRSIGLLGDNIEKLEAAVRYLKEKHA